MLCLDPFQSTEYIPLPITLGPDRRRFQGDLALGWPIPRLFASDDTTTPAARCNSQLLDLPLPILLPSSTTILSLHRPPVFPLPSSSCFPLHCHPVLPIRNYTRRWPMFIIIPFASDGTDSGSNFGKGIGLYSCAGAGAS